MARDGVVAKLGSQLDASRQILKNRRGICLAQSARLLFEQVTIFTEPRAAISLLPWRRGDGPLFVGGPLDADYRRPGACLRAQSPR